MHAKRLEFRNKTNKPISVDSLLRVELRDTGVWWAIIDGQEFEMIEIEADEALDQSVVSVAVDLERGRFYFETTMPLGFDPMN